MREHSVVVVVGAGYPGVLAAHRFTQRDQVIVTPISRRLPAAKRERGSSR